MFEDILIVYFYVISFRHSLNSQKKEQTFEKLLLL